MKWRLEQIRHLWCRLVHGPHDYVWARWSIPFGLYVPDPYVEIWGCCRRCGRLELEIEQNGRRLA